MAFQPPPELTPAACRNHQRVRCFHPRAGRTLAVFAIVVEAKGAAASAFYEGFGFGPFPLHPRRLFLLTSTAVEAVERL